jgi:hypothetical protein
MRHSRVYRKFGAVYDVLPTIAVVNVIAAFIFCLSFPLIIPSMPRHNYGCMSGMRIVCDQHPIYAACSMTISAGVFAVILFLAFSALKWWTGILESLSVSGISSTLAKIQFGIAELLWAAISAGLAMMAVMRGPDDKGLRFYLATAGVVVFSCVYWTLIEAIEVCRSRTSSSAKS